MESTKGIDALFLYATEGILVANEKSEIIRINPSAEKLFGYNSGELIGKKVETLIPQRYSHKHVGHRDKYNGNPHARSMGGGVELSGLRKDGSEFFVEISLSPYSTEEGKFTIAFIVDITHRKQVEEKIKNYSAELEQQVKNRTLILEEAIHELEKTKEDLNISLEKEKELNELKTRFVSMASHEFRTPLATILSSLSLVSKYVDLNDKEKQTKHIEKIKYSITHMTDILNDVLSVSKLEEGKISISPENIDIKDFTANVVSELQSVAKENQKIKYTHSGETIAYIDKKILRNILFNLISNAIKFSPENKPIEVSTTIANEQLEISIKDNGIGISEEDQKHLFDRFFRGQNASNIQGTGLGLNIVAKYVDILGGKLDFKSKLEEGTTFMITLQNK